MVSSSAQSEDSSGSRSGFSKFSSSLSFRLGLPIVVGALIIAIAGFYTFNTMQRGTAEAQAVKQAESVVAQMLATRSVYTQTVVGKLKADEAPVGFSPDFDGNKGIIPLPATLVHRISDEVNKQGLYSIDLISPWPINPDKGPAPGWEQEAIQ